VAAEVINLVSTEVSYDLIVFIVLVGLRPENSFSVELPLAILIWARKQTRCRAREMIQHETIKSRPG
jgi:hypothetical protein